MADIKVSQMGEVLVASDNDLLNLVSYDDQNQTYVSGKVKASTLKSYMVDDLKVSDLYDTTITTPTDDDGLVYDATAQKWENVPIMTKAQWKKNGAYNILENKGVSQVITDGGANITVQKQPNGEMWIYGTTSSSAVYAYLNAIVNCDEDYMLVGTPTSAVPNYDYHVFAPIYNKSDDSLADTAIDYGQGVIVPKNAGRYCIPQITIKANQTISSDNPIKFKPMMTTDLTATYADYVPYAKTNRELTEDWNTVIGPLSFTYANSLTSSDILIYAYRYGKIVVLSFICPNKNLLPAAAWGTLAIANGFPKPVSDGGNYTQAVHGRTVTNNSPYIFTVTSTGAFMLRKQDSSASSDSMQAYEGGIIVYLTTD